jgi:hypothetical protein
VRDRLLRSGHDGELLGRYQLHRGHELRHLRWRDRELSRGAAVLVDAQLRPLWKRDEVLPVDLPEVG